MSSTARPPVEQRWLAHGFLDAMGSTLLVAAAVAGVGSILTYVFLPSRSAEASAEANAVPVGVEAGVDAARALLAERGFAGTTVEAIAGRAGVGKATIYRRWPTREALLLAVTTTDLPTIPTPDTGDLREDLRLVFVRLAEQVQLAGPASYLGDLSASPPATPRCARTSKSSSNSVAEVRKEIDPDLVLDLISGAIFYRKLFSEDHADTDYVERAIDAVLDGIVIDR